MLLSDRFLGFFMVPSQGPWNFNFMGKSLVSLLCDFQEKTVCTLLPSLRLLRISKEFNLLMIQIYFLGLFFSSNFVFYFLNFIYFQVYVIQRICDTNFNCQTRKNSTMRFIVLHISLILPRLKMLNRLLTAKICLLNRAKKRKHGKNKHKHFVNRRKITVTLPTRIKDTKEINNHRKNIISRKMLFL